LSGVYEIKKKGLCQWHQGQVLDVIDPDDPSNVFQVFIMDENYSLPQQRLVKAT